MPDGGRGSGLPIDVEALAAVLDEFAATVTGDFAVHDILSQLARGATRVLQLEGAGVAAPSAEEGGIHPAFSTNGVVEKLERLQEELQQGPCWDTHASGRVINLADVVEEGAWPAYQRLADEMDIHAVCAIPLRARGQGWGVLDLYRSAPVPLSQEELAAATTLANLATSYFVVTDDRDTARKAQFELRRLAMLDDLTGLPMRWVFLEQLALCLARLRRTSSMVAVLFLDLDGLKYVNDTYGHAAGDALITTCVDRVRAVLRPSDVLARMGGDELVVLLDDLADAAQAEAVAERIRQTLVEPFHVNDAQLRPSASIGIAVTSDPETAGATLVAHADSAMYQAKQAGRGLTMIFDAHHYASHRANAAAKKELAAELRSALDTDQLELHYQPIVDLTGSPEGGLPGALHAVEALLRWHHPRLGLLSAGSFIETAERSALLPRLGTWALRAACRQLSAWDDELGSRAPRRLFVNLSPMELAEQHFSRDVTRTLSETCLAPDRITLEITETGLFEQSRSREALDSLSALGCRLAIDDFGTGYSSLSRLADLPVSTIKIDRWFAARLSAKPSAPAVVSAVVALGRQLGHTVVAEGVEDQDTLEELSRLGVEVVQGFHLARPISAADLASLLAGHS